MPATKKIKSFTVDEETYNSLIAMFRKYNVNVSISQFVDGCLKELIAHLQGLEETIKLNKEFQVKGLLTRSIDNIVNSKDGRGYDSVEANMFLIGELEERLYEIGEKEKKHSKLLLQLTRKGGACELSKDNKSIVNKSTGERYKTFRTKDGLLTTNLEPTQ